MSTSNIVYLLIVISPLFLREGLILQVYIGYRKNSHRSIPSHIPPGLTLSLQNLPCIPVHSYSHSVRKANNSPVCIIVLSIQGLSGMILIFRWGLEGNITCQGGEASIAIICNILGTAFFCLNRPAFDLQNAA